MRVLVCGSRKYTDRVALWGYLDKFHYSERGPIKVIIHGGASGADYLADKWAIANSVTRFKFMPDWAAHGRAAGPIRNGVMLKKARPNVVIAFPSKGPGTADMIRQATDANVEVIRPYV